MDVLDGTNPRWATWTNRTLLEGMAASNTRPNPYTRRPAGQHRVHQRLAWPVAARPEPAVRAGVATRRISCRCRPSRRSSGPLRRHREHRRQGTPTAMPAATGTTSACSTACRPSATGRSRRSEFLQAQCGRSAAGRNAPATWCRRAVRSSRQLLNGATWDPWSQRNQVYSVDPLAPAPRNAGRHRRRCVPCIARAWCSAATSTSRSSTGGITSSRCSTCTTRHQSFASRKRMLNADGDASNQVVWFTDTRERRAACSTRRPEALEVIDEWMANVRANPSLGRGGGQQAAARHGPLLQRPGVSRSRQVRASGTASSTRRPPGACTTAFPTFSTTRRVAGGRVRAELLQVPADPGGPGDGSRVLRHVDAESGPGRRRCRRSSRRACATTASRTRGYRRVVIRYGR